MSYVFSRPRRACAWCALALALSFIAATSVVAQEHVHPPEKPKADTTCTPMEAMPGMAAVVCPDKPDMKMFGPLGLSTYRQGSGTTWVPDAVTLPFYHVPAKGWDVMAHGLVFGQYIHQQGPRGDRQVGSVNWSMIMASRPLAGGRLQLRAMNSIEAWTVTPRGYPVLLQTGEEYNSAPIHDRQHPHDFFMELGALYEHALSRSVATFLYVAASGEPALGPVAFMHRPSAENDPIVTLGHHWQDASHISFGVVTSGVYTRRVKLEASMFNAREPDQHRWNFDLKEARLDSYAGRVLANPTPNWSLSASYGLLREADESMHRMTGAVLHGLSIGAVGHWSSALVWGANKHPGTALEHSALIESNYEPNGRDALFGRLESVRKTAEDLVLTGRPADESFALVALSLGYVREVGARRGTSFGVGARGTINLLPETLQSAYGSRTPVGVVLFMRVRPSARAMHMGGMQH